MDVSTSVLLGVVGVIAANQVVARLPWAARTPWVFWPVAFIDLGVAVAVLVLGLPGFEHVPAVSLVVGLMLLMHLAHGLQRRSALLRDDAQAAAREASRERSRALQQALEAAEGPSDDA